ARHALHLGRELWPTGLRNPGLDAVSIPADAAAGRYRALGVDAARRLGCLHHHCGMAAAVARRHVERRALPLEQAFRIHEVPRSTVADEPDAGAGPGRVRRRGPARARATRVAD